MKNLSTFRRPGFRQVVLSVTFFFVGSLSTLVLLMVSFSMLASRQRLESKAGMEPPKVHSSAPSKKVAPWGRLEAVPIPLANADGAIPDENERLQKPKWFFENATEGRLIRFLNSCDLLPAQKKILLDKKFWNVTTNGCEISPPEMLVWSLNSQARRQIYSVLARSAANYPQRFPFRFSTGGFENLLVGRGLTAQNVEKIVRLAYTNSASLCFTDLQTAKEILTPDGYEDLAETLYEIPAFSLRLHVNAISDVEALVNYWGKGAREKRIRPFLKALAKVPGGGSINVSYLLPPFARLRLYTYPDAWEDPSVSSQDCFFTSMNFFNETPDTNFFNNAYGQRVLHEDYVAIDDEPNYGDVITLLDSSGKAIHMCVYIAADFVFTKNGINPAQPWVLMRMSDMLMTYYGPRNSGRMMVLRRKDTLQSRECNALAVGGAPLLEPRSKPSAHNGEVKIK